MKRHKYTLGAVLLLIAAPIFIIIIQTILTSRSTMGLLSLRRLTSIGRTFLYGGLVGVMATLIGGWMGYNIARSYNSSRVLSLLTLSTMAMPPFMYAFFAMEFSRVFLGLPFISGFWVSLVVSVIYWLPLSISLWILYMIAIPKGFYNEPILSLRTQKAISKISYDMMVMPGKVILLIITLLALNDYAIPSIFAYNTYPIEIMTIFSSSQGLASPFLASLPMTFIAVMLMLMVVKYWQEMSLDLTQSHHPFIRSHPYRHLLGGLFLLVYLLIPVILLILSFLDQSASFYLSRAFVSDMVFSYGSALIAAMIVTLLAYYLVYLFTKYDGLKKVILITLVILFSLPGTLTGLMVNGYYEVIDHIFKIELYKTMIPMVHMLTIRFIAVAFMILWFGFIQLESEILDVASMNSKSTWKILFTVLWPFTKTYVAGAGLVVMMFSIGELSGAMMVIPPGTSTLAVTIYNYLHYGSTDVVAMLVSFIFISIVFLIGLLGLVIYGEERIRS